MSFKQWSAVIQLAGSAVVAIWLFANPPAADAMDFAAIARRLLWAVLALVAFNIVMTIVVVILVSIARREEMKDEAADERDRAIAGLSMRNAYAVGSIAAALALVPLALGADPILAAYALFAAPLLGGVTDAASRLVYYRLG